MTLTGIIFDLDGTLVDSSPDIAAALNTAFEPLGLRPIAADEVLAILGGGPRILVDKALATLDGPRDDADALLRAYTEAYRAAPAERTEFFADAASALPALHQRGLRLGVCTNKRTDIAEQVLARLGVRELFDAVIGSDATSHPKPDARHVLATAEHMGTDPQGCLYVGDTLIDATAAASAGIAYAHVSWGHPLREAALRIDAFADLIPLASSSSTPDNSQE